MWTVSPRQMTWYSSQFCFKHLVCICPTLISYELFDDVIKVIIQGRSRNEWRRMSRLWVDVRGVNCTSSSGAKKVLEKYHPVMIIEIQDDTTRRNAVLGGQQMIQPTETRKDVLDYFTDDLGYIVEALRDDDGETSDYLAYAL